MVADPARYAARLEHLQRLALRLSRALSYEDAADIVIQATVEAVGAATSGLWLLDEATGHARLVREIGYGDAAAMFRELELDTALPITVAMREARPLWLGTHESYIARFPASADQLRSLVPEPVMVVAALPLLVDGRAIGGLGLSFDAPRAFDDEEREFLSLFAAHAALAIQNNRLFRDQQRVVHRLTQLQELTSSLAGVHTGAEVAQLIAAVGRRAVGSLATAVWAAEDDALYLRGNDGVPEAFIAAWRRIGLDEDSPAVSVHRTHVPLFVETMDDYERVSAEYAARARAAGREHAFVAAPLLAEGTSVGVVSFSFPGGHRFTADDRAYILTLARQCAQALRSAQLHDREQRARAAAERMTVRLQHLQEITAALANVRTPTDVFGIIATLVQDAFGAARSRLYLHSPPRGLVRADHDEYPPENAPERFALDDPESLTAACWRTRAPQFFSSSKDIADASETAASLARATRMQAAATVPLQLGEDDPLGVLALAFTEPRTFDDDDRALLVSIGQQLAYAVQRVQLQQENLVARRDAEAASRAKDEFLAMLGHELRNPLAPIVTALDLMRVGVDPVRTAKARDVIERQVTHMQRLVDDLLDVSRIARGRIELRPEIVDVAAIIHAALEITRPAVREREHDVTTAIQDGLRVEADPARLAQVLTNILINAARYTPPRGTIAVRARADGERVVIEVEDNGPGIPPSVAGQVFEAFIQGPQPRDRASGGLGLGLAIVKNLIVQHGGTVGLRSASPHGTIVEVTLPAARALVAEAPRLDPIVETAPPALRVLVVDDNIDAAELLAELLRLHGCEVAVAHDGPTAIEIARTFEAQLALLDIGLPRMDGYELATRLRALPGRAGIPIVALTGYAQAHDVERSQAAGFVDHLRKPLDRETLQAMLARFAPPPA